MTETKQGVAQRVMSEMRTKRERADRVGDYSQNTVQHEQLYGAKQMFASLSAETRTAFDEAIDGGFTPSNLSPTDACLYESGYIAGMNALANRLGLDLEGEDS